MALASADGAKGFEPDPGAQLFATICSTCHQAGGQGLLNVFPPLAGSDFLMADKARSIRILLGGLKGEIHVNGSRYVGEMPKLPLGDEQISAVLSYVRSSFGNRGEPVTLAEVKRERLGLEATQVAGLRVSAVEAQ